ncbi:MAG: class B sortase [Lachnospiraceae bacterium]|nr:class B sortase [Lachnospiraceae bacterium]
MNLNKKLNAIIIVLVIACIVAGVIVVKKVLVDDVEKEVAVQEEVKPTITPVPTPTPKVMLPDLVPYYEKNQDTIGWLKIDGTPIDYPVMFTEGDNEFYLYRSFDKADNKEGTLYIDANSQISTPNTNIIIYGHNMKNDTMFGSLSEYANKSYYDAHPTITFNTLYEQGTYEILGAFYAKVLKKSDTTSFRYYKYFGAETEEEYNTFVNYVKSVREYDTGVETKYGDRFITLSTCSYHVENGRFAVVARLKEDASQTQGNEAEPVS